MSLTGSNSEEKREGGKRGFERGRGCRRGGKRGGEGRGRKKIFNSAVFSFTLTSIRNGMRSTGKEGKKGHRTKGGGEKRPEDVGKGCQAHHYQPIFSLQVQSSRRVAVALF